jgi:type IV pilus assembly protein PilM
MAVGTGRVWAIDIGSNSLKALHLRTEGGAVEVIGFNNIQHGKILTGDGVKAAERDELVALSLRQFVSQNEIGKDEVAVSMPSQNSFARFVNLPPVAAKRIPEIVKYEAVQQIPFDIDDVQWDWQLMTEPGAPEIRVGIFAITNEVVNSTLEHFSRENMRIGYVQMAPMALYNYVLYDRANLFKSANQAVVVVNIGAENTDLVVCTKSTVWQRCILVGGNAFTRAIADTFKLNFQKAEKLKCTAAMSKYARQIFQAMRPVFVDLVSEVQRSLGFYKNSHPDTKLSKIIALGGGTKLRGLLKYLEQSLQIPVERPDSFKRLAINPGVSAAKFHENVSDFGIVYGLGVQGLGLGQVESNLLPRHIARSMAWAGKARYFTAAACALLVVSLMCLGRTVLDRASYAKNEQARQRINNIIDDVRQADNKLEDQQRKGSDYEAKIQEGFGMFKYRDVIPLLHESILSALPNEENNPEQAQLYRAFARGDVETVLEIPRKQREQIFVTSMSVDYVDDVETATFQETGYPRTYSRRTRGYREIETSLSSGLMPSAGSGASKEEKEEKVEGGPGFVVTIAGYSPYESIIELMDPVGVGDDPNSWGFITWLQHLDEIVDGNSPFKLYKKTDHKHFMLDRGPVDLNDNKMPEGIGLKKEIEIKAEGERAGSEQVLIDPMTKEIISKVAERDEEGSVKYRLGKKVYEINDHWFRLKAKFIWEDAPKKIKKAGSAVEESPRY